MRYVGGGLAAVIGLVWGAACASPTVTLATPQPIEIKIELHHDVRVHIDRDVSELIQEEAARAAVAPRGELPRDEVLVGEAKARRALGEQWNGYLGLPAAKPADAERSLAERVNAERRADYEALAAEHDVDRDQIERLAGASRIDAASPGEWVRTPDGRWIEKDETTVVVVEEGSES